MIVDSPITVVKRRAACIYSVGSIRLVQKYAPRLDQRHRFTWGGFTREIQAIRKGTWQSNPKPDRRP
jgi:hypothetical protein